MLSDTWTDTENLSNIIHFKQTFAHAWQDLEDTLLYHHYTNLNIRTLKGPDFFPRVHLPNFNQSTKISRGCIHSIMTKSYTSHRILVPCVKRDISSSQLILYCMQFILKLIKSTNFLLYIPKLNMYYKIQIDLLLTNQNCHIYNLFYTCISFVLSTHRKPLY